jgi:phosphoenolpyruvate phosphomutase
MKRKTSQLRKSLKAKELSFLMEAHDGLSAKIVEEAGFEGIWASGLCISAALGVRDNNEATWTQVLEVVEFMSDVSQIPILLDADTGYGDFNTVRRLVKKMEQRDIAGICIEDKLFPKKNSFIDSDKQELADIEEFCGKIKAAKDAQQDEEFSVIARVEAFVAGWGLAEALKRAHAYHKAGADAILIHSRLSRPVDIIDFMKEWADTAPVVIVPTKFYSTPTEVFREIGVSTVIWANHLMRSSIRAMKETAQKIHEERSLMGVEDQIAPLEEVFRLQGSDELREAERLYLPQKGQGVNAVILAASRGEELGSLTQECPKTMLPIGGVPLLHRLTQTLNEVGVKDITVVRGYRKEMVKAQNITCIDNDDFADTKEVYSLYLAKEQLVGNTLVSFGDILCKKYIIMNILDVDADVVLVVDADWEETRKRGRYADYVSCDNAYKKEYFQQKVLLKRMGHDLQEEEIDGEWIGLFRVTQQGARILCEILDTLSSRADFKTLRLSHLFNAIMENGNSIQVVYIRGHWLDVDDLHDLSLASAF